MDQSITILDVEPTVFFCRQQDALRHVVRITFENGSGATRSGLDLRVSAEGIDETLSPGALPPGKTEIDLLMPDIRSACAVRFELHANGAALHSCTRTWQPQRHWEVHLVHYSHHDLGYTDLPSNVLAEYDGFLDQAIQFCQETEHWPDADARFRYQCEQAWSAVHWSENRSPEEVAALAYYCRNGQIEVTALYGNQTLELCGTEELIRLLYPAFSLKRRYGIEISSAEHNDIPGFTWGLCSVLAGAGVRYFSPGVPLWYFGNAHPLWDTERALPLNMPAACWWEGPDGARVLLWSDLHGHEWQPYNVDQATGELPGMLRALEQAGYAYDLVSYTVRGGHRDNAPPTKRYADLVREWNQRWAYPRLINTTNTPFLRAFEERFGHALRTLRGDVPGTDYPIAAACTTQETAVDRRTHSWLNDAETLAALCTALTAAPYPRSPLERAYRDTFSYDLHCWGLSHVGGPAMDGHWSEKSLFAYRAAALAHDVMLKAGNRLADAIALPDRGSYVTVFNPLSHRRTAIARAAGRTWGPCSSPMHTRAPDEDHPWPALVSGRADGRSLIDPSLSLIDEPFELIDVQTGESVPYQIARLDDPQAAQRWAAERFALGKVDPRHLIEIVFAARDLGPVGYRTYRAAPVERRPTFVNAATVSEQAHPPTLTVENATYRLTVDRAAGVVASLVDKELGRELIDPEAAHPFGQLVVRESETAVVETLTINQVTVCEHGPLYTTVRLRGQASCCPRVTIEIALYHEVRRIDWSVRALRDSTPMREVYVAFPFQVPEPRFRFEAPGAVIAPLRDQWPGSHTDGYGVQNWVNVQGQGWGVIWTPLDTPIAALGGLWPGYVSAAHHGVPGPGYGHPFLQPGELTRGHIYALASYNNFRTNFVNVHPGEWVARFQFSTYRGDADPVRARQTGWDAAHPPLAVWIDGPQSGALPPAASWVQIDAPNVALLTLKAAEDDRGWILRLSEVAGRATSATVSLQPFSIRRAWETDLVEQDEYLLPHTAHTVQIALRANAIHTVRIEV